MHEQKSLEGDGILSGPVPLFPLPGTVLFPCALLPLHIYEPRYRAMVAHVEATDGCIAIAMIRRGFEKHALADPPVEKTACLARIIEAARLPDGQSNIVLCGMRRARIERVSSEGPFRSAHVEMVHEGSGDSPSTGAVDGVDSLRDRLIEIVEDLPPQLLRHKNFGRALRKLDAPLGCVTDLMADSLRIAPARKQELLTEVDPIARGLRLLELIDAELGVGAAATEAPPPARWFPPRPSMN